MAATTQDKDYYFDWATAPVPDVWAVLTVMRDEIQANYDTSSIPGSSSAVSV